MDFQLTGTETADNLIKQLVSLRHYARLVIRARKAGNSMRDHAQQQHDNAPDGETKAAAISALAKIDESDLQLRSAEIEIGDYLFHLCAALDKKASRTQVFEAIGCARGDRDTDLVRKYGEKSHHLICILDLENSATKDDEITTRPLKWCHTMAFMHLLNASPKFDRMVHDGANEFFGGVFGEYRERPLMERLAGRAV